MIEKNDLVLLDNIAKLLRREKYYLTADKLRHLIRKIKEEQE